MRKFLKVNAAKLKTLIDKDVGYNFTVDKFKYEIVDINKDTGEVTVSNGNIDDIELTTYPNMNGVYAN